MSTIDNLKQQLDSLGIKYRSNATESNLKHLLSKHRAQQPKEDKVAQNEVRSDSDSSENITWPADIKFQELPSLKVDDANVMKLGLSSAYGEFGEGENTLQGVMAEITSETPYDLAKGFTPEEIGGEVSVEDAIKNIKEHYTGQKYDPENIIMTLSTTNEDGEPVTVTGFAEEKEISLQRPIHLHTDKPTFGYKNSDLDSDKIVIRTNTLKGFIDQLTQAAIKGYNLSVETNAVNVLDTPYRVKLTKGEPAIVQFMQPEVKIKVKVYKQSDFIKEILRIIKLGGTIGSVRNITMLSGLYVFEALVDSNYELRKNIDFYAGKV
jgi:hypothetical protein